MKFQKGKTYEELYGDNAKIERQKRAFQRKKLSNWKPTYRTIHAWVSRHKPQPFLCEKCSLRRSYDLANISGEYKRDINDYEWLCRSCHMKNDGRMNKLGKTSGRTLSLLSVCGIQRRTIQERVFQDSGGDIDYSFNLR